MVIIIISTLWYYHKIDITIIKLLLYQLYGDYYYNNDDVSNHANDHWDAGETYLEKGGESRPSAASETANTL